MKNHDTPLPPEERNRIVNDAVQHYFGAHPQPTVPPDVAMVRRCQQLATRIFAQVREVLKADAETNGKYDRVACFQLIRHLFHEEFSKMNRDELLFICTVYHSELLLDRIDEEMHGTPEKKPEA